MCNLELYYGGEALTVDQPQSFCCPFCGKLGLTESALPEHVTSEHPDSSSEVVSFICVCRLYCYTKVSDNVLPHQG